MNFKFINPNPNKEESGLCTIRSICVGFNKSWEEIYPQYKHLADNMRHPINSLNVFEEFLYDNGWRIDKSTTMETKVKDYAESNSGVAILDLGDHASCLTDDTLCDTIDCREEVIYTAWKKSE